MAAALKLVTLWGVAAAALLLHGLAGIPGDYLGQGYPITPGLRVTLASLTLDAALATLPLLAAATLAYGMRLRWLALPVLAPLWLWGVAALIDAFKIDFGTTWSTFEPLIELALHPVYTPLALAAVLLAAVALLKRPPRLTG